MSRPGTSLQHGRSELNRVTRLHTHAEGGHWRSPRPGLWIAGHIFEGSQLLSDDDAVGRLIAARRHADLVEQVAQWNGFFSVILNTPHGAFAAVDRVRSYPVFYAHGETELRVGSEAGWVRGAVPHSHRDDEATQEFLLTGYVTGPTTLMSGVLQLQAGEALFVERDDARRGGVAVETVRYTRFERGERERSESALLEALSSAASSSIDRLIAMADGRPIVVPLSGGLDSRLIAALLLRHGNPDVRCFTYGRPGNKESAVSRAVASRLDLPWTFVPYSESQWSRWSVLPDYDHYLSAAHQHTSVPHVQDWPAVMHLTETGAIPANSVIVPGHTGDFTAGRHTLKQFVGVERVSAEQLAYAIVARHYNLGTIAERAEMLRALLDRVLDRLGFSATAELSGLMAINAHDTWNWQERQAKFIVNSVRAYEQWGHSWWLPLWDDDLMRFWQSVPLRYRIDGVLHERHVTSAVGFPVGSVGSEPRRPDKDVGTRLQGARTRLREAIFAGPIGPVARAVRLWRRRTREYGRHPLAWYGIVGRRGFNRRYSGCENINSFIAQDIVARAPESLELKRRRW